MNRASENWGLCRGYIGYTGAFHIVGQIAYYTLNPIPSYHALFGLQGVEY